MRGRKPRPTHLRLIAGNPGRRPMNKNEPVPTTNLTEPPEWMSPSQKDGWRYAMAHAPDGLLKKLDSSILTAWVVAEDVHRQATENVIKFGMLATNRRTGDVTQSPFLVIQRQQALLMMKGASELGFSPSSRSRVSREPDKEPDNPFSDFKEEG